MASADTLYIDPSALRRIYVHDDRSRAFCAWRNRVRGPLSLTLFGRAEIVNSVALAVFRRDIDQAAGDAGQQLRLDHAATPTFGLPGPLAAA